MDAMKLKLLDELLSHLASAQGNDLHSLMSEEAAPKEDPAQAIAGADASEMGPGDKSPKGISMEKVSVLGKPESGMEMGDDDDKSPPDSEMSDEELEELLKKLGG